MLARGCAVSPVRPRTPQPGYFTGRRRARSDSRPIARLEEVLRRKWQFGQSSCVLNFSNGTVLVRSRQSSSYHRLVAGPYDGARSVRFSQALFTEAVSLSYRPYRRVAEFNPELAMLAEIRDNRVRPSLRVTCIESFSFTRDADTTSYGSQRNSRAHRKGRRTSWRSSRSQVLVRHAA